MRSNKKLLIILLGNIHKLKNGLCLLVFVLWDEKVFTAQERDKVQGYIRSHRPKEYKHGKYYYWVPGQKEPRIKWLNEQIEKL